MTRAGGGATESTRPPVGLGILGLGTAGAAMLGAALGHDAVHLVAVADERVESLGLEVLEGCSAYSSLEAMLADPAVKVVHVATPTALHAEHVRLVLEAGRQVIVEKPVTPSAAAAEELRLLAKDAGATVLVGHSESFEPYAVAVGAAVASGRIGEVVTVVAEKLTDWMRRPRLAEELDPSAGGGIVRRQGVHQVDVLRTVAPGRHLEVRMASGHRDLERGLLGGYTAWLGDGDGLTALLVQDGRGVLQGPGRAHGDAPAGAAAQEAGLRAADSGASPGAESREELEKRRRSGQLLAWVLRERRAPALGGGDTERLVVLGSDGWMEASSRGARITSHGRDELIDVAAGREGRGAVLDELVGVLRGAEAVHDLAWGQENLRLCEEIEAAAGAKR